MKKVFIATCIICAVILSCKKKDKDPPKTNTTTTTTGGSGTTTGGTTTGGSGNTAGTPTNATSFHGIFTSAQTSIAAQGYTMNLPIAQVYFSSVPVTEEDPNSGINVNSVILNGETLVYDSAGVYTSTNTLALNLSSEAWIIDGANGIPSFTTNNGLPGPSGLNSGSIPSTINKASGVTINLGTLSNIKTGQLIITDGTSNTSGIFLMPLNSGPQSITLSSGQLAGFTAGNQQASIIVMLENSEARNISGKNFKFVKQVQIFKGLTIN